jgi:hypothetical protein
VTSTFGEHIQLANLNPLGLTKSETNALRFARLLDQVSVLAADEGVAIEPFEDPSLPYFLRLNETEQSQLVQSVDRYASILEDSKKADHFLVNNPNTLWRMLGKLKLRSSPDLYHVLQKEDVVEIYDQNCRQIYCSFNFFRLCSYTLEMIYSVPWYELYARDQVMTQANFDAMNNVLKHPEHGTVLTEIPVHEVHELISSKCRVTAVRHRFCSPLFDTKGGPAGFVNAFQPVSSRQIVN